MAFDFVGDVVGALKSYQSGTDDLSRLGYWDVGLLGYLPDPDPILRARGDDVSILRDILADSEVSAAVEERQSGTLLRGWEWRAGADPDGKISRAAEKLRDQIAKDLPPRRMRHWIAEMLGTIPVEILWAGKTRIKGLRPLPSDRILFDKNRIPRYKKDLTDTVGAEIPPKKMVLVRHRPTWSNPYGHRILSTLFWPVTFKRGGLGFWVKFMEKYGLPHTFAMVSDEDYEKHKDDIAASLSQMVQDAVAVIKAGTEIKIAEAEAGRAEVFERFCAAMDAYISRAIRGETLTSDTGKHGSRAAGEVHERTAERRELSDAMMVQDEMDQVGFYYAEMNAPGVAAPIFRFKEKENLQAERAERDGKLYQAGVRFTKQYFVNTYGFSESDIDEAAAPAQMHDHARTESTHQREIDAFIEEQIRRAVRVTDAEIEKIMRVAKKAKSFSDLEDRLLLALDNADARTFASAMEGALIAADIYGHVAMHEEAR